MKKIFTLLSAALIGGAVCSAQVTIGETSYANLNDAVAAAAEGDVIMINEDITINNRVNLTDVDNLTVKAADGVTVNCLVKNKLAFLVKKTATLENLNMVYVEADASNQGLIECSTGAGKLTIKNCTVSDFNTTSNQGVVSVKGGGHANFNGFAVNTTTVPEGRGEVFFGTSGSTLSGNSTASIFLEKNLNVTANADFAPDQVVNIYIDGGRTEGSTVVSGTEDAAKFHLVSDIFKLKASNGNLIAADINDVAAATIGSVEYDSFDAALAAVQEGETIIVNKNLDFSGRVNFQKEFAFTVQGANSDITFSSNTGNKSLSFLVNQPLTLKDLTLVWTGGENVSSFVECSGAAGNLTLDNVTISGVNTTSNQGVIALKNKGVATLNNVTFAGCIVPEGRGEVFIGQSGSTFSGNTNASIFIEKSLSFNGADFAPAAPVKLYLDAARTVGSDVVLGTTEMSNFELQGTTFSLDVKDGNIIAVEYGQSGVEEVEAADAAAAVYYNVNGVAVDAANLVPGLYIRVQGAKATKILVK